MSSCWALLILNSYGLIYVEVFFMNQELLTYVTFNNHAEIGTRLLILDIDINGIKQSMVSRIDLALKMINME